MPHWSCFLLKNSAENAASVAKVKNYEEISATRIRLNIANGVEKECGWLLVPREKLNFPRYS